LRHAIPIAALLAWFCATGSHAEEPTFGSGAGMKTCAEFATVYQTQPKIIEDIFYTWTQGYLTGFNVASGDRLFQVDLGVWTVDAQKSHIRDYCDSHPLKQYINAVLDLMAAMKYDDVKIHGKDAW